MEELLRQLGIAFTALFTWLELSITVSHGILVLIFVFGVIVGLFIPRTKGKSK